MKHIPYCQALEELRNRQSHKLKEVGDQWCTPDAIWWGINARFGPFTLDLFADDHNAKCENYYTAENNALTEDWSGRLSTIGGAAYVNPPYSREELELTGSMILKQIKRAAMKLVGVAS